MYRKNLLRAFWLLAILVVVIGSLLPASSFPMRTLAQIDVNDKIQHLAAYLLLAFLPAVHERWKFIIAAAVGAVTLGVSLEFGQLYSPGRSFEIGDMIADAVGVCSGLALGIPLRFSGMVRSLLCTSRN